MTEIEKALQELEDYSFHHSLKPELSTETVITCAKALQEKQEREPFEKRYFNDMWRICEIVYRKKPEVKSFNKYVAGLIEKDLGRRLKEAQEDGK